MNVFELRNQLVNDYKSYVSSFIQIRDNRIRAHVEEQLGSGLLWPEPLIQLNPAFQPANYVDGLVDEGILHKTCKAIFRRKREDDAPGSKLRLHQHQEDTIRVAHSGNNYVLTTGTGSGKSLAYIIPIVDFVLKNGSGKGIQALDSTPKCNRLIEEYFKRGFEVKAFSRTMIESIDSNLGFRSCNF